MAFDKLQLQIKDNAGIVSPGNTTTTVPSVASPFVGDWHQDSLFPNVMVTVACDAPGTIYFEFYDIDGTTPTAGTTPTSRFPVTGFSYDGSGFNEFHQAVKGIRWFRVQFVPDSEPTSFRINTYFVSDSIANLPLNQSVPSDQDATVTRAFLAGFKSDGTSANVPIDQTDRLKVVGKGTIETFGDQLVTNRQDQIFVSFSNQTPDIVVTTDETGSGGVTNVAAQTTVFSGTTSGSTAKMETRRRVKYRPSHEIYAMFTATFSAPTSNGSQFIGLFDDNNGFAIGYSGTDFCVRRRNGGVDTDVLLDDFNGSLDADFTRDGEIESLNPQLGNVYRIRFGWLGNAPIKFDVMNPDGEWTEIHTIRYPNSNINAHVESPDLPLRSEVSNGSDSANVSIATSSWAAGTSQTPVQMETIFQKRTPADPPLPSGSIPVIDMVRNNEANVIDTGWINVRDDFPGGQFLSIQADQSVLVFLLNASDDQGNNIEGIDFPSVTTTANNPSISAAPFFDDYFRIIIINNSGNTVNEYTIRSQGTNVPPASIYRSIDQQIFDFFPAPLSRAVTTGRNPDGFYVNSPIGGISNSNSSQVALAEDEVSTGTYVDIRGMSSIFAFAFSDKPLSEIKLQWSSDGVNPRPGLLSASDFTSSEVLTGGFYVYLIVSTVMIDSYVRLDITNGPTANTIFESDLWLMDSPYAGTFQSPADDITNISSALLTRAISVGRQPDGDYVNTPADGTAFSSTTPLAADGEITTGWIDTDGFKEIEVFVSTGVIGTIVVEFTPDANAATPVAAGQPLSFEYDADAIANGQKVLKFGPSLDGVRITYENGPTSQTNFLIEVSFRSQITALPQGSFSDKLERNSSVVFTKGGLSAADNAGRVEDIGRDGDGPAINIYQVGSVDVPIKATEKFKTGQLNVTSQQRIQIPFPDNMTNPKTLSVTNLDKDTNVFWGNSLVTALNGDVILPVGTKDIDFDGSTPVFLITANDGTTQNNLSLNASTVDSSTAVTNPSDALTSNDLRASLTGITSTMQVSGFDLAGVITLPSIADVKIVLEARKQPSAGNEIATFNNSVGLQYTDVTSMTSPTLTAKSTCIYVVAVSRRDDAADVTTITNTMGFTGATLIADANNNDESRTSVYYMNGIPNQNGSITVNFDTGIDHGVISVTSLNDVNLTDPISDSKIFAGSASSYSGTLSAQANGIYYAAIGSEVITHNDTGILPSGAVERFQDGSTSQNDQMQSVVTGQTPTTTTINYGGSMSGTDDLTGVFVTFKPSPARDPRVRLRYNTNAEGFGETELVQTLTSTTDVVFEQSVLLDRDWSVADVDNTVLVIDVLDIGVANARIDRIGMKISETGGLSRVSYVWVGDD